MRFVRLIAGILLLTIGLPTLLVGGALWTISQQRGPDGSFGGPLDRVDTAGHAIVVPDLAGLLRRDAPFLRSGRTGLRVVARTGPDPAFIGLAPAAEASAYLSTGSYARIDRVSVTRGSLPLRVSPADQPGTGAAIGLPVEQRLWIRHGIGVLNLTPDDLRGPRLSLVVMRPDAQAGVAADLRAEVRPGWLDPVAWSLLSAGILLSMVGIVLLARPVRPREVVFVVEPSQVPAFAAQLGIAALNALGRAPDQVGRPAQDSASVPAGAVPNSSVSAGGSPPTRPAVSPTRPGAPPTRPATLADVLTPAGGARGASTAEPAPRPTWPPINPGAGMPLGSPVLARIPAGAPLPVRSARAPAPAPAPAPMPAPPPAPVPAPTPAPPLPSPIPPMPAPPRPVPVPAASAGSAPAAAAPAPVVSVSGAAVVSAESVFRQEAAEAVPVEVGAEPVGAEVVVTPVGDDAGAGAVGAEAVAAAGDRPALEPVETASTEIGSVRRLALRPASPGAAPYDLGPSRTARTARTALNRPKGYEPMTRSAAMDSSVGRRTGNAVPEESEIEPAQQRRTDNRKPSTTSPVR